MRQLILLTMLPFFSIFLKAGDNTIIMGKDPSYSSTEIIFNVMNDPVSNTEKVLTSCRVSDDGSFLVSFSINEVTQVFAYLGIYKVHLYAVPGETYEVVLPPRQEKQPGDFLNPYFSPTIIHLGTLHFKEDDLNTSIRMFNDSYLPYYNKHILKLNTTADFSELDKDIARMEKAFSSSNNQFFNDYRKYRYGLLRYLAFQHKSKSISNDYFRNFPVLYNNLAYVELFNKVYDKYFYRFSNTDQGKVLAENISARDLSAIRKTLSTDDVLGSGELLDLVILKSVHDEFYDDNYSRSALLDVLDTFILKGQDTSLNTVAKSIRRKVTRLLAGFDPPQFELYDRDSNLIKLENFKGKYVYLNFCSCFSYTCMNEFLMLNTLYDKHKNILEIVTVLVDNDRDVINSYLNRSNYPWKFLHYGNQSTIIKDYDIRAFPTYYLIDKAGKLAISPAPSPGDDFEARFFKLLRERGEL